jgi:pimeloyl-ACP methyl ester carboxylesterase
MESSASAGRVASAVLDPRRWWALALLCGAFFMVLLDGVSVVLAEEADRAAGRQIDCPTLLLNATDDDIDIHGDPKRIWEPWVAGALSSAAIHSGHHQAGQAAGELVRALRDFLVTPMQPASQP